MDLFSEKLYSVFEDLIEDDDEVLLYDEVASNESCHLAVNVQSMSATSLSLGEMQQECAKRGIRFSGFLDDATELQRAFDQEYEEYIETKRIEIEEMKRAQEELKATRARNRLKNIVLSEERKAYQCDIYIQKLLKLIWESQCQEFCRLPVNDITGRLLAKAILSNITIKHLDLSGLHLCDVTGSFLFRSLVKNRTVIKVDVSENLFRWKTLHTLAEALKANDCIEYINLSSNTMSCTDDDWIGGFNDMADMLRENRNLKYLSLWNCHIGTVAGKILVEGIKKNDSIICFDTGYNGLSLDQEKAIGSKLEINTQKRAINEERIRKRTSEKENQNSIELAAKKKDADQVNRQKWLDKQKDTRAVERRMLLEERWKSCEEKERHSCCKIEEPPLDNNKAKTSKKSAGKKNKKKKK